MMSCWRDLLTDLSATVLSKFTYLVSLTPPFGVGVLPPTVGLVIFVGGIEGMGVMRTLLVSKPMLPCEEAKLIEPTSTSSCAPYLLLALLLPLILEP